MTNNKTLYAGLGFLIVVALLYGAFSIFQSQTHMQQAAANPPRGDIGPKLNEAYAKVTGANLSFTQGDPQFTSALQTFRDVAADDTSTNLQKASALNGINFAYTQSNYDAADVKNIVFSSPPFAQYYTPIATAQKVDPLHPESGPDVQAVEAAITKLIELSNSLSPSHYAISRLEVAQEFAFDREAAGLAPADRQALLATYANKVQGLIAAYDALPVLDENTGYSLPQRMQIIYVQASIEHFVGAGTNNKEDLDKGEADFKQVIQLGDAFPKTDRGAIAILDETLLARIFYASSYWNIYKDSNPQYIKDLLLPLTNDDRVKQTAVYTQYLPSHKNANNVQPFLGLRAIATQMPELKKFLQGLGWKF